MHVPLEPGKDGRVRSHWPLRSEPDEVMSAKQLADACVEARTDEDKKYALGEAASFLSGLGGGADSRALIALLRLSPDDDSEELLAEVERRLAERAPAVVGALLQVAVESDHPVCDNAAAALDQMPEVDLAQGLIEVLEDDTHAGLKRAAAAGLITLGPQAAGQIVAALGDPDVRDWITEAAGCPLDATDDEVMEAIESDDAESFAGGAGEEDTGAEETGDDIEEDDVGSESDDEPNDAISDDAESHRADEDTEDRPELDDCVDGDLNEPPVDEEEDEDARQRR
jgi:hypothetical protein